MLRALSYLAWFWMPGFDIFDWNSILYWWSDSISSFYLRICAVNHKYMLRWEEVTMSDASFCHIKCAFFVCVWLFWTLILWILLSLLLNFLFSVAYFKTCGFLGFFVLKHHFSKWIFLPFITLCGIWVEKLLLIYIIIIRFDVLIITKKLKNSKNKR